MNVAEAQLGSLEASRLRASYRRGDRTPVQVLTAVLARIANYPGQGVWISRVEPDQVLAASAALRTEDLERLPLFGVPFAVKDNIDVAGLPTTAACPDFSADAETTALLVERLLAAGAILVGKTNLDQFATGLNGTRSPYGVPESVFGEGLISGGSSSGSAVAVAAGLVSFAIGTDTAGSGRVPAALNNVVGLKPSIDLVSNHGVVPASRSLDCASVFALSVADASRVLDVMTERRPAGGELRCRPALVPDSDAGVLDGIRLAVPATDPTWGDRGEQQAWEMACARLRDAGAILEPVEMDCFLEAGTHLYGGAWLAERAEGLHAFVSARPDAVLPVIREVLHPAESISGMDVFASMRTLDDLRARAHAVLADYDGLLTPTVTETFTIEEMLANPVALNGRLGTFTAFTNLLDLCALAVPAGLTVQEVPFGVSLQAPAGRDEQLADVAARVMRVCSTGAGGPGLGGASGAALELAVVGAHLHGMPLHDDLLRRGAVLVERTTTSADYRLYALTGTEPAKPGLQRVPEAGERIEVEVYRVPLDQIGGLLATVSSPLAVGQVTLQTGRRVHGFVCEPHGLQDATDITGFGGWRSYRSSVAAGTAG